MEAVIAVISKFAIDPVRLYVLSLQYAEIRMSKQRTEKWFCDCCVIVDKKYVLDCVPECVTNFCLDLLTGRTTIPQQRRLTNGRETK